jgi:outer membrane murein-binding lipoprotein Lpp
VSLGKGIAIGFVAGLAVAGGAFLLLRESQGAAQSTDAGDLKAQVERLESAVTKLSELANRPQAAAPVTASRAAAPPQTPAQSKEKDPAQVQAVAEAEALVDQGVQSGRWSMQQADELSAAVSGLDVNDQGRILARVSKAINDGQIRFDPTH